MNDGADATAFHDDTAGEIIAVALKASPVGADHLLIEDSADGGNKKRVSVSTLPGTDYALLFGAVTTTVGSFYPAGGSTKTPALLALDAKAEWVAPRASRLAVLTWSSTGADATTVLKIHVNGAVAETITVTGAQGTAALSTAIAVGDRIAVEWDAGTNPTAAIVAVYLRP